MKTGYILTDPVDACTFRQANNITSISIIQFMNSFNLAPQIKQEDMKDRPTIMSKNGRVKGGLPEGRRASEAVEVCGYFHI